jgi:hypothetical protein
MSGLGRRARKLGERLSAIFALAALVSACSLHPLPENVTSLSTYNIVRQIRCETREAVIDSILRFLTDEKNYTGRTASGQRKVDEASRNVGLRFAADYRANPFSISQFDPKLLSGFAKTVIELLWNTGIAYNFDLQMKEINDVDPAINLLRMFSKSTQMLGLKGNFDRQRQNTRSFTITDNFADFVKKVPANYCDGQIVEANIVYPIAGNVGMHAVVHDFLFLTLFGNLSGDASKDITSTKGPPTMVDQLQFMTTIGGSVTPTVTFTPVGPGTVVSNATLGLTASRTDTHTLTVGLYLADPGVKVINEARPSIFQGIFVPPAVPAQEPVTTFGGLLTASGGAAEQGAAKAIEQFLTQRLFQPTLVVNP